MGNGKLWGKEIEEFEGRWGKERGELCFLRLRVGQDLNF